MRSAWLVLAISLACHASAQAQEPQAVPSKYLIQFPADSCLRRSFAPLIYDQNGPSKKYLSETLAALAARFSVGPIVLDPTLLPMASAGKAPGPVVEKPKVVIPLQPEVEAKPVPDAVFQPPKGVKVDSVSAGDKKYYLVSIEGSAGTKVVSAKAGSPLSGFYEGSAEFSRLYRVSGYMDLSGRGALSPNGSLLLTSIGFSNGASVGFTFDQAARFSTMPWGYSYAAGMGAGVRVSGADGATHFRITAAPTVTNVSGSPSFAPLVLGVFEVTP